MTGFVVLKPLDTKKKLSFKSNIGRNSPLAEVVAMGKQEKKYPYDPNLKVGCITVFPMTGKREHKIDGQKYIFVHHKEIRFVLDKKKG